ncbi:esterase/lipase family protein [Streptomyces sp. Act-28]
MREPPPPVTAAALRADALRSVVLEAAVLAGHLFLYPAGLAPEGLRPCRRPAAPYGAVPRGTRPPVVLLHGLSDNRSVFVPLRRALVRDGARHVRAVNHSPLTRDLRAAAHRLADHVDELLARTGHDEVDHVGHRQGGRVAPDEVTVRYYKMTLPPQVKLFI